MALKVLLLRKQKDGLQKELNEALAKRTELQERESELAAAINELNEDATDEEKAAVDEAVEAFEKEKAETDEKVADLEDRVKTIEDEISAEEDKQGEDKPEPKPAPEGGEGGEEGGQRSQKRNGGTYPMNKVKNFRSLPEHEARAIMEREDVKAFLTEVRTAIKEKRALEGVGLLAPEVFLGMIKENLENYSKLYKHVTVRQLSGNGREVIMGTIPEAVWTDCCGVVNEMSLVFNDVELGCWKVGGYFDVCNANIEDSDINLADELLTALGQAIGYALDKAIVYGLGTRMPLGFVTRLAQTSKPADYPDTARTWVDLHTTNIKKFTKTGIELFAEILKDSAAAKGKYSRGQRVWIMNETTYTQLKAEGLSISAAGSIVSGMEGSMPVAGGVVEVLEFMADGDIAYGYLDLYLLGERRGITLASSEHTKFIQDRTVFKGTARYDGQPSIAEAFGIMNINNVNPTTTINFAPDTANTESA